jgi:hypothetical protein
LWSSTPFDHTFPVPQVVQVHVEAHATPTAAGAATTKGKKGKKGKKGDKDKKEGKPTFFEVSHTGTANECVAQAHTRVMSNMAAIEDSEPLSSHLLTLGSSVCLFL